jgi:hypothetical protein
MEDLTWLQRFVENQGVAVALVIWGVAFFSYRIWPAIEAGGRAIGPVIERIAAALEAGVSHVARLVDVEEQKLDAHVSSPGPSPPSADCR